MLGKERGIVEEDLRAMFAHNSIREINGATLAEAIKESKQVISQYLRQTNDKAIKKVSLLNTSFYKALHLHSENSLLSNDGLLLLLIMRKLLQLA